MEFSPTIHILREESGFNHSPKKNSSHPCNLVDLYRHASIHAYIRINHNVYIMICIYIYIIIEYHIISCHVVSCHIYIYMYIHAIVYIPDICVILFYLILSCFVLSYLLLCCIISYYIMLSSMSFILYIHR